MEINVLALAHLDSMQELITNAYLAKALACSAI
jgi:hypothetical protein